MISFAEKVYNVTRKIPRGKVATYARIARAAGSPRSARAVGNALNKNTNSYTSLSLRSLARSRADTKLVPCHRVVRSDGSLGGFAAGTEKKRKILTKEGIVIKDGKIDLKRYLYR